MSYPVKEVTTPFGNTDYVEMTPEEYEEALHCYERVLKVNKQKYNKLSRREKEYTNYLDRWFSNFPCDGIDSVDTRLKLHLLPMSFIIYSFS